MFHKQLAKMQAAFFIPGFVFGMCQPFDPEKERIQKGKRFSGQRLMHLISPYVQSGKVHRQRPYGGFLGCSQAGEILSTFSI